MRDGSSGTRDDKMPPKRKLPDGRVLHWFTTSPHPGVVAGWKRSRTHGADDGQVGWRLHAVILDEGYDLWPKDESIKRPVALCGLRPAWGWGLDLFIDQPCARCMRAVTKSESAQRQRSDGPEA